MSVKIQDNTPKLKIDVQRGINLTLRYALDEVDKLAFPKTPKDRGELRKNIRKTVSASRGTIQWASNYAAFQERGYSSGPIRRYTTPGTGAHFAENAVKAVDIEAMARKAKLI